VIYGDTSQDGLWYGGDPETVDGHEFGPKPFDPPYWLADEDDAWVFPLGNPFDHAGNDVIDASRLFAGVACTDAACTNLPSVGVTIYGGAGNDTIIGSQAGDHLAGGSGDDLILGQRGNAPVEGVDHGPGQGLSHVADAQADDLAVGVGLLEG
jgi:Ca2+-binding RTX toxin-like protein